MGRTSIRQSPDGVSYMISSFFDIFTEISLDGGQTWSPSLGEPTTMSLRDGVIISLGLSPGNLLLNWSSGGVLQQSTNLLLWIDVPGAVSPFRVIPIQPNMFYRIRQ